MAEIAHVLLTRFNLRYGGTYDARYSDAWMEHRLDLFERYCLPAVSRQTETGFEWIVLFDRERSERWLGTIERLAGSGLFRPVFLESSYDLVAEIANRLPPHELLLTSRLDNDDVVHPQYISDIQRHARACLDQGWPAPFVLDFEFASWWYVRRKEIKQFRNKNVSPYASLLEGGGTPETVFVRTHKELPARFERVHLIPGDRALTLVHDRNVLNGITTRSWPARAWLRIKEGQRFVAGEKAIRILADFGVDPSPGAPAPGGLPAGPGDR